MKYSDLINLKSCITTENGLGNGYIIRRYSAEVSIFTIFRPLRISSRLRKEISTNWKARLSIHPEDMNKAWDVIFPFLYQNNIYFKVANLQSVEKFKNNRQEKLENHQH